MPAKHRCSIPALLVGLVLFAAVGCDIDPQTGMPRKVRPADPPPAEFPVANLHSSLRPENWGGGSCVHASLIYQLRWAEHFNLAAEWRQTYSGGETANGIRSKLDAAGVDYVSTDSADPKFLDWCTRTRRAALIWYYPSHCVAFVGWHTDGSGRRFAILNDNNRPNQFIEIPEEKFIPNWRGYGGFGLSVTYSPTVPVPWSAFVASH